MGKRKGSKLDGGIPSTQTLLAAATVSWYDEILERYLKDAHTFEARLLAAEAFVEALQTIAERDPVDGQLIKKFLIAKIKV
ncbi:MAG: hypothetical protein WC972_02425 [Trueperaceae bacterium]